MKQAVLLGLSVLTVSLWADVTVTGVKVQPRSPWNGMVDIEYTVVSDEADADVYINPTVYDGDRRITLFPNALTGDGVTNTVKAGKHRMTWDAMKDVGAYGCANFQFKIYAGKRLAKYVKIDLSSGSSSTNFPVTLSCVGPDVTKDACRTTELWLRLVPPGEFWMGSPENELGREDNETLHHVTFTQPFYMGIFEVTQKQYELVTRIARGSYFGSSTNWAVRPVENTRLDYIRGHYLPLKTTGFKNSSFVSKLRIKAHNGGFDLPSESRWEYACRAGTMTAVNNGKDLMDVTSSGALAEVAAYFGNSYADQSYSGTSVDVGTQRVGSFAANVLGLYDMQGNVAELCRDSIYNKVSWGADECVDPEPMVRYQLISTSYDTSHSAIRGGDWKSIAVKCRSAARNQARTYTGSYDNLDSTVGFRICAEAGF